MRQQHSRHPFTSKQDATKQPASQSPEHNLQPSDSLTPGSQLVDVISGINRGSRVLPHSDSGWCHAYVAGKEGYCGRASTLQAYAEVNRRVCGFVACCFSETFSRFCQCKLPTSTSKTWLCCSDACMMLLPGKCGLLCTKDRESPLPDFWSLACNVALACGEPAQCQLYNKEVSGNQVLYLQSVKQSMM